MFWRPLPESASDDAGPWRHLHRIRDPYRTETDIPSTLLHAHETRSLTLDDPDARGAIEAALFYKRDPYWKVLDTPDPEAEAILVHRIELRP